MRLTNLLLLSAMAIILTGSCMKRARLGPVVLGDNYSYRQAGTSGGAPVYLVWARDEPAFKRAMTEVGCGICTREPNGIIEVVTVIKRK